jgi:hypothetical protein
MAAEYPSFIKMGRFSDLIPAPFPSRSSAYKCTPKWAWSPSAVHLQVGLITVSECTSKCAWSTHLQTCSISPFEWTWSTLRLCLKRNLRVINYSLALFVGLTTYRTLYRDHSWFVFWYSPLTFFRYRSFRLRWAVPQLRTWRIPQCL